MKAKIDGRLDALRVVLEPESVVEQLLLELLVRQTEERQLLSRAATGPTEEQLRGGGNEVALMNLIAAVARLKDERMVKVVERIHKLVGADAVQEVLRRIAGELEQDHVHRKAGG